MTRPLDDALQDLRAAPVDHDLSQLEPAVWRRIGGARMERAPAFGFVPMRAAMVVLALMAGVAIGGATAVSQVAAPRETEVFALNSQLAPSTLLDARR